jgi:EAL domain-containing protein (putative c-di-GMP-specific phosphodiesterase class I)
VSPLEFIPLAEETGLIIPIGDWVLHQACSDASRWTGGLKVAVNLSAVQFKDAHLVATVEHALRAACLPAHRLELEITESVLLEEREETLAMLHQLRDLGVRIALDDFGTGYSSLSYLRRFPFDKLKIDRSFIRELTHDQGSQAIVRTIIALASSLGMDTTAEGVETAEQRTLLRLTGCTELQGFLFSPPRERAEFERWLDQDSEKLGRAAA